MDDKQTQAGFKILVNSFYSSLNQDYDNDKDKTENKNDKFISSLSNKNNQNHIFIILIFLLIISIVFFVHKNKKEKLDMEILRGDLKILVNQYEYLLDKKETIPDDSPIWIMWYQGIKEAPPLIKACIQSVILNRVNHPVYIVDKYNLNKYIELPEYILQKFNEKKFDVTHFSDILRMALLSKYGGYWIDSTYFIKTPLIHNEYSLFTLKLSECYPGTVTKCRWAGNFLGMPKRSFLSVYAYNAFLFYWKNYDKLIDYFLIDEIIYVAYLNSLKLQRLIDKLPYVFCDVFNLHASLNQEFNYKDFQCSFNKLNRRNSQKETIDNKITNYGYLINQYKLDINNINNLNVN